MKKIINYIYIIFFSALFPAYYAINDTVNLADHLIHSIEVCYGTSEENTGVSFTLSDNPEKITVIGLEIPWWILYGPSSSLEALAQNFEFDSRLKIMQNLDDIGQPYNCEGWANSCGGVSYDIIDDGSNGADDYFLQSLFGLNNYFHSIVILDENMVFRYFFDAWYDTINTSDLIEIIRDMLNSIDYTLGDFNYDSNLDILDVILIVNIIIYENELDQSTASMIDMNYDSQIDITDVIEVINIILL